MSQQARQGLFAREHQESGRDSSMSQEVYWKPVDTLQQDKDKIWIFRSFVPSLCAFWKDVCIKKKNIYIYASGLIWGPENANFMS